jgi:hypothetical protein
MTGTSDGERCILISGSSTTGWFDWVHGRLWLCSTGLLRESTGLVATVARFGRPLAFDVADRPVRHLTVADRQATVEAGPRNAWIAWSDIARATLKPGIVDHSLHLERTDGTRVKFLWLKSDGGFDLLAEALGAALGDRLRVHDSPIG